MSVLITRNVCLEPQFLDSKYMENLLKKLVISTKNECSKEYGHILSVIRIVKIIGNHISSADSDIVFTIQFEATTLKPVVGEEMSGDVCMIFRDGIFVNIGDKLKVLVPLSSLAGYELDKSSSFYSKGDKDIKQGDIVTVTIEATQYAKKSFSCFGNLSDRGLKDL